MKVEEKSVYFMKEYLDIDGHKNGMFIESSNLKNPILLFLHGGPGFPQYASIKKSRLTWEEDFTVCYWEQRGTGMSYNTSTQGIVTLERLVLDTVRVTEFLKGKLNQHILLF